MAAGKERLRSLSRSERLAALSLATSASQKQLMDWVGHHPLLSPADLSVLMDWPEGLVKRLLGRLENVQLVAFVMRPVAGEVRPPRGYFLTSLGLRLLAARDRVPPRRYARYGVLAAAGESDAKEGERLTGLLRHFEHTVGANSFFVRVAADARRAGHRLLRWLSAAECAERFSYADRIYWLRPDGYGELEWNGSVHRFFLEWDRGTSRWPDIIDKFRLYAAYFASLQRDGAQEHALPEVLVITTSPLREKIIWRVLDATFGEAAGTPARFLTSVDTLVQRVGPGGCVWRSCDSLGRVLWLDEGDDRQC